MTYITNHDPRYPPASHTHSISIPMTYNHNLTAMGWEQEHPSWKEPPMTTLEKIQAERKEARERERINFLYQAYDNAHYDDLESGTLLRFEWTANDKTYTYAAIIADERWYVTGRESPNGLATEDFVAWLIGKDVEVDDIEVIVP